MSNKLILYNVDYSQPVRFVKVVAKLLGLELELRCNQRMFFNAASLFVRVRDCSIPIIYNGATEVSPEKLEPVIATFDILEAFLAGQNLTIADIAAALSVPYLEPFVQLQADKHPKILAWLSRVSLTILKILAWLSRVSRVSLTSETIPFFEEMNGKYLKEYGKRIFEALEKNKQK